MRAQVGAWERHLGGLKYYATSTVTSPHRKEARDELTLMMQRQRMRLTERKLAMRLTLMMQRHEIMRLIERKLAMRLTLIMQREEIMDARLDLELIQKNALKLS
ncbi:hypothetical protein KIN20_033547 [Parelaphostrongylus tenuis]|uniref:Uncharacterized protein n=1 Tax=Parelaphostrongylus tenuis TaxID=148309 RepID=A0AAD5WJA9_PARTN|nr:hypothetical protein KIN20_033547 [Parelaphostrongylus tenuis]